MIVSIALGAAVGGLAGLLEHMRGQRAEHRRILCRIKSYCV